jgi:5-methylcytosine-specific restriction endonuclease McrA
LSGPPDPKARSLTRGARRYRRRVASAKQWQRIIDAKIGPCRVCCNPATNGGGLPKVYMHHVVSRQDGGDDVPDNIVPLCWDCHDRVTLRWYLECRRLIAALSDAEYAYMVERGGEDYPERAYGITYQRGGAT